MDERKFLLTQPDGISRRFWRKTPVDTALMGQGNWAGEIKDSSITLWASCGWKLVFYKGKIVSITTPKNRVLNVMYANGQPSEIQEQGRTALKVERDLSGEVRGLSFGGGRIGVEMGERPRVEVVQGTNVVGGNEKSLHGLTLVDKKRAVYEFGVDEQQFPTLAISGDASRSFTWNPATGRLVKDGEWSYDIKSGSDRWANAAIERTNAKKQSEYWFNDSKNGTEIIRGLNGIQRTTILFTSGLMTGKIREVQEVANGVRRTVLKNSYDELGRPTRKLLPHGSVITYNYLGVGTHEYNATITESSIIHKIEFRKTADGYLETDVNITNGVVTKKEYDSVMKLKQLSVLHP